MKRVFASLRRLHPLAWAVLVVASLAMILIVVPGFPADRPSLTFPPKVMRTLASGAIVTGGPPSIILEFEHGWPWTFERRALGYSGSASNLWPPHPLNTAGGISRTGVYGGTLVHGFEISWTSPLSWTLAKSDLSEFSLLALMADGLVAVGLVAGIVAGCQRWIRRRGSIWRWRIIDFAALLALVAVSLGFWKWSARRSERDAALITSLHEQVSNFESGLWRYRGPTWLARLIGSNQSLSFCNRLVHFNSVWMKGTAEDWAKVSRLTALEHLEISGNQPTASDARRLANLPRLKSVGWQNIPPDVVASLPELNQVDRIVLYDCEVPLTILEPVIRAMQPIEVVVRRAKFHPGVLFELERQFGWRLEPNEYLVAWNANGDLTAGQLHEIVRDGLRSRGIEATTDTWEPVRTAIHRALDVDLDEITENARLRGDLGPR
jgi:hypothetical protein